MYKILILSLTLTLFSCSFFQQQVGEGTSYQYGKLEGFVEYSVAKVDKATLKALEDMKLRAPVHNHDAFYSVFETKNAKDQDVVVNLEKITDNTCKITIKIGFTGDRPFSQAIFDKIKENL